MKYRNRKNAEAVSRYWGKPLDRPDWYKINNSASEDSAEVLIYDVIGWPFNDAGELVRTIKDLGGKDITVRINSPGGDVFDGLALFNAIDMYSGRVITRIEGLAASMASIVAIGGDEVQSHANAMMMIHEPWTYMAGNQHDMREVADILEKISGNMLDIYYGKAGNGKRELKQMMREETWLTAKEAKENRLIDTIIEKPAVKASFDLSMFAKTPDDLAVKAEGRELTEREIERALRDAGASRSFAKSYIAGKPLRDAGEIGAVQNLISKIQGVFKS